MASRGASVAGSTSGTGAAPRRGLTRAEHVVHTIAIAGFAIQALTGFGAEWIVGEVAGWALFIHMLGAPLFIIGLTGTALMWADRCRFGNGNPPAVGNLTLGQKLMFWIAVVLGYVVLLPMLAAMLPVFGYAEQHMLVEIHEISAILLLVAMIAHSFVSLGARWAKR